MTLLYSLTRIWSGSVLALLTLTWAGPAVRADTSALTAPTPTVLQLDVEVQRVDTLVNSIRKGDHYAGSEFDSTPYTGHTSSEVRFSAFYPLGYFTHEDELRFVVAPFISSGTAPLTAPLNYDGAAFLPGRPLSVFYKFNTYRATYDAPIWQANGWVLRLGGTIALRDAHIALTQPGVSRDYRNVGPVPLLYVSIKKPLGDRWSAGVEFDAFPAPGGGGLFDGSARLSCRVYASASLFVGTRYQFGGASEPDFYNSIRQIDGIVGLAYRF